MATRLYFETLGPVFFPVGVTPSSWSAGWNKTTSTSTALLLVRNRTASGNVNIGRAASGTSGHFTAGGRYVSPPLQAQTISGTIKGQVRCSETVDTDNFTLAVAVKVIQSDGSDRGILVGVSASDNTAAAPPEMATSNTNRQFLTSAESASISLSSLAVSAGDRLVVEIGIRQASTSTATPQVLIEVGNATDLPEDNTTTTVNNAWIEFSQDLLFGVTFFKDAATPAGNNAIATGTADPTAVTPPSGVAAGDLVCMIGHQRAAGVTLAVSQASGQAWTTENAIGGTNITARLFWCIFNGTWGSDPSVDFSATTCNSVQLLVFRPPTNYMWGSNVAQVELDIAAAATQTITGQTTVGENPTLTLAGWFTADDNTWGNQAGTGWEVAGQLYTWYVNTSGSDQSSSYAFNAKMTAGATGNVSKDQTANGNDAATSLIITWEAVPKPPPPTIALQAATRASFW